MATTISISNELKDKISNLGKAGESYEDVIRRMYEFTRRNLIRQWLYDETDTITLEEWKAELDAKWPE